MRTENQETLRGEVRIISFWEAFLSGSPLQAFADFFELTGKVVKSPALHM